jgi:hypothetical protein
MEATDFETVVQDLLSGQYKNPVRVISFNTAEGWSQDVSADILLAGLRRPLRRPLSRRPAAATNSNDRAMLSGSWPRLARPPASACTSEHALLLLSIAGISARRRLEEVGRPLNSDQNSSAFFGFIGCLPQRCCTLRSTRADIRLSSSSPRAGHMFLVAPDDQALRELDREAPAPARMLLRATNLSD